MFCSYFEGEFIASESVDGLIVDLCESRNRINGCNTPVTVFEEVGTVKDYLD